MTVEAGNTVGTDGAPPQVPPNSAAAGSEVESFRRPGGAKQAAEAEEVDVVVGGVVGGRLKVT